MKLYRFKSKKALEDFADDFSANKNFVEWFLSEYQWHKEFYLNLVDDRLLMNILDGYVPESFQDFFNLDEVEEYLELVTVTDSDKQYKIKTVCKSFVELNGEYSSEDLKQILEELEKAESNV